MTTRTLEDHISSMNYRLQYHLEDEQTEESVRALLNECKLLANIRGLLTGAIVIEEIQE